MDRSFPPGAQSCQLLVVAGVAGAGKTTLARALAARLNWRFVEADDYHSEAARQRMAGGLALSDAERWPWLDRLNGALRAGGPAVLACSALKEAYRQRLSNGLRSRWIWLDLPIASARERLQRREGHFMPASLIDSQYAIAEPPSGGVRVDACQPLETLIRASLLAFGE